MQAENHLHILIIEDSPDDRAEARRMMLLGSQRHYSFTEASSGAEGLRLLDERMPDCILLDYNLPDMDALEILESLRERSGLTPCPVVVLTGSIDSGAAVIRAGAQDYLGKDWATPQVLTRSIHNALERYAMAREHLASVEKLRIAEEFSRTVLENSPDCVQVLDTEGNLILLNEPGRHLLEIDDIAGVIGRKWWDTWPPASHRHQLAAFRRALKGYLSQFDAFLPTAKGKTKWWDVRVSPVVNPNGRVERIVAVLRDVTERHHAQEILRQSGARLALGLEVSGVSLAQVDYLADTIELTPEAAALLGLEKQAIIIPRRRFHATFHPADREEIQRNLALALAPEGGGSFVMEHRVVLPDGEVRWLRVHKQVFFHGAGPQAQPGTGLLAMLDITERKRNELRLAESAKRKDEFLAMLAHELRNPLAPLLTGMDLLLKSPGDLAMVEKIGGMMNRQIGQMTHLIDDLLDISRITSRKVELQRAEVPLAKIIEPAIESVVPLIEARGHRLIASNPHGNLVIQGDPHRLTQVVSNLLSNAAKYTPPGGSIHLDVAWEPGGQVTITVSDNGTGISPEHQESIFELFDQGSAGSKDGLGIGLTLVKSLVEMHGGNVTVRSEGEGKGSRFSVHLPGVVDSPSPLPVTATETAAPAPGPGKLRVLVADDGRSAADILGMFFEMEGLIPLVTYDGAAAVEAARSHQPDLVLLDLGMPIMDGYQAAGLIREIVPGAYIVALSGWGSPNDRERTREAGFDEHLVKPASPADLRALLARVTERG